MIDGSNLHNSSRSSHITDYLQQLSRSVSLSFQHIHSHNSLTIFTVSSQFFLFPTFSSNLSNSFLSVSVITSICFPHPPALSSPLAHFLSSSPPPSLLSLGGQRCRGSFPNLLILSFFISPSQAPHTHTSAPISPLAPSLSSLPGRPWHKRICSIPPANRLVGCYQRQGDGDNGFHHIFSLPQIKMGQVTHRIRKHTHAHTLSRSLTNTRTQQHKDMSSHVCQRNIQ